MTFSADRQTLLLHAGTPSAALRPAEAWKLVQRFGPLARWWLNDEVLCRAAQRARRLGNEDEARFWTASPALSAGPGACWLVFANQDERAVHLRPAFLLPLQWVADRPHSPRLWDNLRRLAEQVVDQLAAHDPAARGWGLQLSEQVEPSLAECDLSDLDFACQSGWAALLVGLYLALGAGQPRTDVFASAAWDERQGLQAVDGVADKLELARVRNAWAFFLPDVPQVRQQASAWEAQHGVAAPWVRWLSPGPADPLAAVSEIIGVLEACPLVSDSQERRRGFYLRQLHRQLKSPEARYDYYMQVLLPTIVDRCREQFRRRWADWRPTHLVTVVSKSPDLACLAGSVHADQSGLRCLLLHTDDLAERYAQVAAYLQTLGVHCQGATFDLRSDLPEDFRRIVGAFLQDAPAAQVAFDLTAGTRDILLSLFSVAPPGSRVYTWPTDFDESTKSHVPFSERLFGWEVGGR